MFHVSPPPSLLLGVMWPGTDGVNRSRPISPTSIGTPAITSPPRAWPPPNIEPDPKSFPPKRLDAQSESFSHPMIPLPAALATPPPGPSADLVYIGLPLLP